MHFTSEASNIEIQPFTLFRFDGLTTENQPLSMSLFFRHKVELKNFVQQLQVVAARQGVEVLCELLSAGSEARFGTFAAGSTCPPQTKGLRILDLLEDDLKVL